MKLFRYVVSIPMLLLCHVVMAQKQHPVPAALPPFEILGLQLGMTRVQVDSVVSVHEWRYADSVDGKLRVTAGDEATDETIRSLGSTFCESAGDSLVCALAKDITLTFKEGTLWGIAVESPAWPLEHCMDSWHRYKAMERVLMAKYGEPPPEPESDVKPDFIGPKAPMVSWLLRKGRYPFTQSVTILSSSDSQHNCSSRLFAQIESEPNE